MDDHLSPEDSQEVLRLSILEDADLKVENIEPACWSHGRSITRWLIASHRDIQSQLKSAALVLFTLISLDCFRTSDKDGILGWLRDVSPSQGLLQPVNRRLKKPLRGRNVSQPSQFPVFVWCSETSFFVFLGLKLFENHWRERVVVLPGWLLRRPLRPSWSSTGRPLPAHHLCSCCPGNIISYMYRH